MNKDIEVPSWQKEGRKWKETSNLGSKCNFTKVLGSHLQFSPKCQKFIFGRRAPSQSLSPPPFSSSFSFSFCFFVPFSSSLSILSLSHFLVLPLFVLSLSPSVYTSRCSVLVTLKQRYNVWKNYLDKTKWKEIREINIAFFDTEHIQRVYKLIYSAKYNKTTNQLIQLHC